MIHTLLLVSGRMYGGGQRVVLDLLEESQKWMNGAVDLCLLGGPVATMPPVHAEVVEYDGRYNRPMTLWKTSRRLRNAIRRLKPDLVHSHGWDAAMIGALALVGLPAAHLIHIHTTDVWLESKKLKHYVRRLLTRWMFNRPATTVVAVSDAVRSHWCRALDWPLQSFRVIRNGVDPARFHSSHHNEESKNRALIIGVAARLQPNKGLENLFRALVMLEKDNLHPVLLVAGEGGLRGVLESRVEQLGLQEQVKFLGFVQDMKRFYHNIDVAALPSLSGEGLPLFVLEAMSCGVPVVATDVGGTKEALRDGVDGFVVPPHEPAALAAALRKLIEDPDRRRQMGSNARTRIEADFSRTVFFEGVSGLYHEMLEQGTPRFAKAAQANV
jgi:glycosyltransferase involved in cell wall biosynthesis